jgi:hypothetical protein
VVERTDVRVGQVVDVDVVADARAVGRGVVVAEHLHRGPLAEHGLHHERDEVERRAQSSPITRRRSLRRR